MHFKTLQTGLFISLLVAATTLFGWLIHEYILSIFWATVLAILFYPAYQRLYVYTKERAALASLLTIGFILIVVLVPLFILGSLVVKETVALYTQFAQDDGASSILLIQAQQLLVPLEQFGVDVPTIQNEVLTFAKSFSTQAGNYALEAGRATLQTVIATLLMLYILFFTLRDGKAIILRVQQALPLGNVKEEMLFRRFTAIVRAMFKGTFIIALIQGVLGGILFALVGVQGAALWAFVMGIFALIPAVGPAIVWLPVGLLLLFSGSVWQGVAVLAFGTIVISLVDNLLRPFLVAKDTEMPDVLILLSVLGGLTLFGIAGLIIGPVITAFFLSMWQLFEHDYATELKIHG